MPPVVGSSLSASTAEVAQPITEVVASTNDGGWPWWKWALAGLGVYGGLTLIGWLTKPDASTKKPAKSVAPPGRGGHGHAHRQGGGLSPEALARINEQIQTLVDRQEFEGAEKIIKSVTAQLEQTLQTGQSGVETVMELLSFQKKLADVYRLAGKYDLAEERLEDLWKAFTEFQAPPAELAALKQELSSLAEERKDHKKAERLLLEALQLQEQSEGPNSAANWAIVYKLGMFKKNDSNWVAAEAQFRKVVKLLEGAPRASLDQARLIANQIKMEIVEMLLEQKKTAEAEELFRKVSDECVRKEATYMHYLDISKLFTRQNNYERAEYWLNNALELPELPPAARYAILNDLANVYADTGRVDEAKHLYEEIKNKSDEAPFTDSRYFKTLATTEENHHYRLVLGLHSLPEDRSLPNNTFLEAIFEPVAGSEEFTVTNVLDEATLNKKEIEVASERIETLPALPRLVTVNIWWDDTKSKKLGVHRQVFKNKVLRPFLSFNELAAAAAAANQKEEEEEEEESHGHSHAHGHKKSKVEVEEVEDEEEVTTSTSPSTEKKEEESEEVVVGEESKKDEGATEEAETEAAVEEEEQEGEKENEEEVKLTPKEQKEIEEQAAAEEFEATLEAALEDPVVEDSLKDVIEEVLEEEDKKRAAEQGEEEGEEEQQQKLPTSTSAGVVIEDAPEEEEEEQAETF